ncbi:hypothetical protein M569_00647 [Genlisea aurea]|uniref:Uncharacterized protein n=1 Tax=Genlisea aurea TaxID=192259 RepID=S8EDR8_9LAMI|nr:hypothetical protein M569_00647 [Genlisea aurea]
MSEDKKLRRQERQSSSSSSCSWRKGKREKPKQPQRGLGVAQLEKIRLNNQMRNNSSFSYGFPYHHQAMEAHVGVMMSLEGKGNGAMVTDQTRPFFLDDSEFEGGDSSFLIQKRKKLTSSCQEPEIDLELRL